MIRAMHIKKKVGAMVKWYSEPVVLTGAVLLLENYVG